MNFRSILCLLFAICLGCGSDDRPKSDGPRPLSRAEVEGNLEFVYGSQEVVDVIQNATRVTAWRTPLASAGLMPFELHAPTLDEKLVISPPLDVSPSNLKALSETLLDPTTFDWDSVHTCLPDYVARVQFATDQGKVDLLFCFQCETFGLYRNGNAVLFEHQTDGFSAGRPRLVEALKKIFPDDKIIQSLTPQRQPIEAVVPANQAK